jgi:hypothetical protein
MKIFTEQVEYPIRQLQITGQLCLVSTNKSVMTILSITYDYFVNNFYLYPYYSLPSRAFNLKDPIFRIYKN